MPFVVQSFGVFEELEDGRYGFTLKRRELSRFRRLVGDYEGPFKEVLGGMLADFVGGFTQFAEPSSDDEVEILVEV